MKINIVCEKCGIELKSSMDIDYLGDLKIAVNSCTNLNCIDCGDCDELNVFKSIRNELEEKLKIAHNLIEELESDKEKSERIENELAEKLSRAYDVITSLENKSNL